MKLNVANPATGAQKLFDFDDERKVRVFMEKQMGQEVPADSLGDEWKGYVPPALSRLYILTVIVAQIRAQDHRYAACGRASVCPC